MQPLASIVIPVFNGESFIEPCLKSIAEQTMTNLQIIVVDDGSTDQTLDIIKKFTAKDTRVHVIHQENSGVSKARNVGLQAVQAEWVFFVDADDQIAPDYCASMLEAADILGADAVIARPSTSNKPYRYLLDEKSGLVKSCLSFDEIRYPFNIDAPWGKIFRSSIIQKYNICFPENLTRSEDAFFCLQFYEKAEKIGVLNHFGYFHIERVGSLCRRFDSHAPEMLEEILTTNYQWVINYHADEMDYIQALWSRVLPGIVECERLYFMHPDFSDKLVCSYQKFLKQPMIDRAICSLKLIDVKNKKQRMRLLFYKLHLGWLFPVCKRSIVCLKSK